MLSKRNLPILNLERYKQVFGFPIRGYYQKAGFDFELEPFENLAREYITEYDNRCGECNLHTGVTDILRKIRSLGITQSVLSASNIESLQDVINNSEITEYFSYINGLSNNFAESKIDIGIKWLSTQQFKTHEVLIIGDTEHDFEVANAMGIDCVLISHGHQDIERLRRYNVQVYETLKELGKVFEAPHPCGSGFEGTLAII
jgi:phosphoglycolate phosphatase